MPDESGGLVSRRSVLLLSAAGVTLGGVHTYRSLREADSRRAAARGTGRELWASAFGAVGDGSVDDGPALRRALSAALAAGRGATLRLEPGRYRVWGEPGSSYALPISGARDLSIAGEDASIVVSDPALGCISLTNCEDCQVEGVSIDYDPPPFTQTVVTALDPLSRAFDVAAIPGYPLLDEPHFSYAVPGGARTGAFGAFFDPVTRLLRNGVTDHLYVTAAETLGPGSFRLRTLESLPVGVEAGDVFVYLARKHGHALSCYRSPRTSVRDVTVRASNGVAFAVVQSDAASIHGCTVAVEPGSDRLVSSNADGVHAQNCRIGPTVAGCTFAGMMDDGLNVYALPLEIRAVVSEEEMVVAGSGPVVAGSGPVRIGDRLEFSDPVSGRITGRRRVAHVTPTGSSADLRLRLATALPGLSSAMDGVGDSVFNLSASGENYLIRGNRFERHRGHAMRLHTGRGVVERNYIARTSREGISVSNDPDWPEGPHTRDLVIRDNTVELTGGDAAIDVEGRKLGHRLADTATQRELRIVSNTVRNWRGSAIAIGAAKNVELLDNLLIVDEDAEASAAERGILLERAHGVEIDGLVLESSMPNVPSSAIEVTPSVSSGVLGVRIRDLQLPAGVLPVRDLRVRAWTPSLTVASASAHSRLADAVELSTRVGWSR